MMAEPIANGSPTWEFTLLAVTGTASVESGQVVTALIPRGVEPVAAVHATVDGRDVQLDGATLRLLLLHLHNPFPIEIAHIGAHRWAVSLSSSHGSLAWTDGDDYGRTTYRLFSRERGQSPELTRWRRVGLVDLDDLLAAGGWGHDPSRKRAFWRLVAKGLPRQVPVHSRSMTTTPEVALAPEGGWLDVGDGLLSEPPPIVPLYAVEVVAPWGKPVEYPPE